MVIASTADSAFDKVSIGVGISSMIAFLGKDSNLVKVRGCNFILSLFDGKEGFTCAFNVKIARLASGGPSIMCF